MKKYIISIGYCHFVVEDAEKALSFLECQVVNTEYVDNKTIYIPDKDSKVEIKLVDESFIRTMTEEEKENKELSQAKSSAQFHQNQNKDLQKQIEELKCQIKVLTKETDPSKETD